MNFVERLFLGTMAISFTVLFFFFSIYFDVGHFFGGAVVKTTGLEGALLEDALVRMDSIGVSGGEEGVRFGNAAMDLPSGGVFDAGLSPYAAGGEDAAVREMIEIMAERLRRRGFKDERYVAMESLKIDRRALENVCRAVEEAMDRGRMEEALSFFWKRVSEVSPDNLHVLADWWRRAMSLSMATGRFDLAADAMERYLKVLSSIIRIKERAGVDSAGEREALRRMRTEFARYMEEARRRGGMPACSIPIGARLSAERASELRRTLRRALVSGRLDRSTYRKVVEEVGITP